MVVKTHISLDQMDQLLSCYPLGSLINVTPIHLGHTQSNYYIEMEQGKFIFKLYENRSFESVLFERDLLLFLNYHHFPSPAPVPDQRGKYVRSFQGKPYLVIEFVEGVHIENLEASQQRQVIQNVARLQTLTRNYQPAYKSYRWNYDIDLCRRLASQAAQKINTMDAHQKYIWVEEQLSFLNLPDALPKGICHCDFHYANLLFRDGVFVSLLDFDDANHTYLTFDLACLIDGWAWPFPSEQVIWEQAQRLTQDYEKTRPFSDLERDHLMDVHKLSILFDCIWFFDRGSASDFYERKKIEYLDAMRRDRYVQALFSR